MASINKVILVGRCGQDPEVRYPPTGAITSITVATSESWKDKVTGEKKELTEWHRISFFGKLAEIAGQYLKKGSQVYIEGKLRTNKYTDRDGIERYQTGIIASTMQMLGSRQDGQTQQPAQRSTGRNSYAEAKQTGQMPDDDLSDIPF